MAPQGSGWTKTALNQNRAEAIAAMRSEDPDVADPAHQAVVPWRVP